MSETTVFYSHPKYEIALRCKDCKGLLREETQSCLECDSRFSVKNGVPIFLDAEAAERIAADEKSDAENAFKNFFKRWPKLYRLLVHMFVPVLFNGVSAKRFLRELPTAPERILNIGSGPTMLHENVLNVDVFPFPNVHILAEAERLPFADDTFDAVCSEQVLEHVRRPAAVARELVRVTKPGGFIYTATPYMFPLHPSPKDYSRWSIEGLFDLFEGCEPARAGIRNGPVSGMLIVMSSGLAMIFSFGFAPLRKINTYFFMAVLSPFKLLDFLYSKLPGAEEAAGSVWAVVRKRA